jgi:hypothetical protein
MGICSQRLDPAALPPAKGTSTHFAEGWVVLKSGLYGYGKFRRHRGSNTQTFQPITSSYTDGATPIATVTPFRGLI